MNRKTLALITAGCIGLHAPAAHAAEFIYSAALSGSQEVPAVPTPGSGLTTVTYNDTLHTLRVQVSFADLIGTTTAAHIHVFFPPSLLGGVATELPSFGGFPLGVTAGSYDNTYDMTLVSTWNPAFVASNGGTAAGAEQGFSTALSEGRAYLNVHSTFRPGGEIRGNLAAVPEPASWAMLMVGFFGLGSILRSRRALSPARASST